MVARHAAYTGSAFAATLLDDFTHYLPLFRKIISPEYQKMQEAITALQAQGLSPDAAAMRAFAERNA